MIRLARARGGRPEDPHRRDALDFVLWQPSLPDEPAWRAPFGVGRPGWHIECSVMAMATLGETLDLHGGGTDLIFPHHEMSASHARVALEPGAFARHYVHAGMVRLDGEKMSKSLGNLVFVSRLLADGHDPMAVRLAILAHRYRHDWDWTAAGLAAAEDRLARWRRAVALGVGGPGGERSRAVAVLAAVRERMADDLDAPGALAVVDRWADAVLAVSAAPAASLVRDTVDALLGVSL